jgi:hypothetical protein
VRRLLAALLILSGAAEAGRVWRVGPEQSLTRMADAARVAGDGDIVDIDAGSYRGADAVAVWTQHRLHLRARGGPVQLRADGHSAEGKAIWVLRGGDISVEGIEFFGARVPDRNGAGIRLESGSLHLRACRFEDNEMGLMTSNDAAIRLHIERSEFAHAHWPGQGASHLLYAGRIARLRVEASSFHHGRVGHLLKSRAAVNEIIGNRLIDGDGGRASYEVDLPEGGQALLEGNEIEQSLGTENLTLIAFGLEGLRPGTHRLTLRGNRLRNRALGAARWIRVADGARAEVVDNVFHGLGWLETAGVMARGNAYQPR